MSRRVSSSPCPSGATDLGSRPLPSEAARAIGALCVGADWACAHGDLAGLRHVARELAAHVPEPLRGKLLEIARACLVDPDRAAARWATVGHGVRRSVRARRPGATRLERR